MKATRRYRYTIFMAAVLCAATVTFALSLPWRWTVLFSALDWGCLLGAWAWSRVLDWAWAKDASRSRPRPGRCP